MRRRMMCVVSLAGLWVCMLLVFLQHALPVVSFPLGLASASSGDVVINEIAWSGTISNTNHEWIELKNNTALTVSLTSWRLRSSDGSPSTTLSGEIPPWGYFLLARTNYTNVVDVPADMIYTGALVDGGEILTLTDNLDNVVDTANANGGPWPAGTGGSGTPPRATMERVNSLAPDTDANWATNDGIIRNGHDVGGNPINGTPKQPNSATHANLGIAQSAPASALMDQAITYTLLFSNAGRLNVVSAIITDKIPPSTTFVAQTSTYTFTQVGQELVWQVGTLLTSSENLSLTFVVTPEAGFTGWLTNTAVITSEVADYRRDNNVVTATTLIRSPLADLGISKSGPMSVMGGSEFTYTIAFSNTGEVGAANVIVTDTLPLSATLVRSTEAYSFSQPISGTLAWQVDSVPVGGQPLSLTVVVTTVPGMSGWLTNQVTITTMTAETVITNNASTVTTQVTPQSADVSLAKSAPTALTAGSEITYVITISNVGQLDAQDVHVTDTLPISVTFLRQSASYTFTRARQVFVWNLGDVPASALPVSWTVTSLVDVSFSGVMTNTVEASTVTYERVAADNSAQAATLVMPPSPVVLINGVLYDGYQLYDTDEAIQIINVGLLPFNLYNWRVTKGTSSGAIFPTYTLPVNQRVWATRNAVAFRDSFGFWPDFAMQGTLSNSTALTLTGSWAELSNTSGGDVRLQDAAGNVVDRLVYLTDSSGSGWSGPGVYPYGVGGAEGQILARVPDERTGLPITDTDTAADWIQYTGSYTTGQRVLYPGWDMTHPDSSMAGFFWPFTSTMPATITLGVAPDNAFDVVRDAIRSAQRSIEIEAYELQHYGVVTEVVQKVRAGVSVTILLEGSPVGGLQDQERWACREIESAGGQCWFMHQDDSAHIHDRYRYLHTKFIVIDREHLVISTQNLSGDGMPDDDKSDGTFGSRGYVLLIESPQLAARAGLIFDRDCDPVHTDIVRWGTFGFSGPAPGFVPVTFSGGTTTTVLFPSPRVITEAASFELFTAPEASLRQSDALLGLLSRAGTGDEVYVEQLYEHPDWGDVSTAPNLRLKAYVDAARRGAKVRILLNGGQFGEDYVDLAQNITTTNYLNTLARQDGLDLQARMGDPTRYGIHSKLVLVKLNGLKATGSQGRAYSHMGSINGSEVPSKINREIAVQVESPGLYAELARIFWADWNLSAPIFLPIVSKPPPFAADLLISEVLYDPSGLDTGKEWVEVFNFTGHEVDLTGWSIGDALTDTTYGAGRYFFPNNTPLPSGGVIVIAQQAVSVTFRPDFEFVVDPNPASNDPSVPDMIPVSSWPTFGFALANAADHVILRDPTGRIVDAVAWGPASDPDSYVPGVVPYPNLIASGHSLERYPPHHDTDDCSVDFRDQPVSTPRSVPR